MDEFFSRSAALLGDPTMEALRSLRVIIFGVGGVGSWAAECLIRTGLIHLTIVDGDTVQPSNLNRQLPATSLTMGQRKVEALRDRLLSINPKSDITALPFFYGAEGKDKEGTYDFQLDTYDYCIDAIDDVHAKTDLILFASRIRSLRLFCSMGAALRLDPTKVTTGELMTIQGDALAKAVRSRMKRLSLHPSRKIRCVYSTEQPLSCPSRGSLMPVTATFGCTLASLLLSSLHEELENKSCILK